MLGRGGIRAGIGRLNGDHRPLQMGRYPMERIKRVDSPTTLIIEDAVPRVPVTPDRHIDFGLQDFCSETPAEARARTSRRQEPSVRVPIGPLAAPSTASVRENPLYGQENATRTREQVQPAKNRSLPARPPSRRLFRMLAGGRHVRWYLTAAALSQPSGLTAAALSTPRLTAA